MFDNDNTNQVKGKDIKGRKKNKTPKQRKKNYCSRLQEDSKKYFL